MLHKKRKDLEALAFAHSLHVGDYIKESFTITVCTVLVEAMILACCSSGHL